MGGREKGEGRRRGGGGGWGAEPMASERHKTKFVQSGKVESRDLKASIGRPCFASPAQLVRAGLKKGFRKKTKKKATVTELLQLFLLFFFLFLFSFESDSSVFSVPSESLRRHTVREGAGRRPAPPRCLQPYAKTCVLLKVPLISVMISFPFTVCVFPHM